jgi:hypothetical protein
MKFAELIEALKNGDVDIVIADMTPTAERVKAFLKLIRKQGGFCRICRCLFFP